MLLPHPLASEGHRAGGALKRAHGVVDGLDVPLEVWFLVKRVAAPVARERALPLMHVLRVPLEMVLAVERHAAPVAIESPRRGTRVDRGGARLDGVVVGARAFGAAAVRVRVRVPRALARRERRVRQRRQRRQRERRGEGDRRREAMCGGAQTARAGAGGHKVHKLSLA